MVMHDLVRGHFAEDAEEPAGWERGAARARDFGVLDRRPDADLKVRGGERELVLLGEPIDVVEDG